MTRSDVIVNCNARAENALIETSRRTVDYDDIKHAATMIARRIDNDVIEVVGRFAADSRER